MLLTLVLAFYGVLAFVLLYVLWITSARPWVFRQQVPVPRELPMVTWEPVDQDNPIPWI